MKAQEFLKKLSVQLGTDTTLLHNFEKVVDPDISCKDCQVYVVCFYSFILRFRQVYRYEPCNKLLCIYASFVYRIKSLKNLDRPS